MLYILLYCCNYYSGVYSIYYAVCTAVYVMKWMCQACVQGATFWRNDVFYLCIVRILYTSCADVSQCTRLSREEHIYGRLYNGAFCTYLVFSENTAVLYVMYNMRNGDQTSNKQQTYFLLLLFIYIYIYPRPRIIVPGRGKSYTAANCCTSIV